MMKRLSFTFWRKYVRGETFPFNKSLRFQEDQSNTSKEEAGIILLVFLLSKDPTDTQGKFSISTILPVFVVVACLVMHVVYVL